MLNRRRLASLFVMDHPDADVQRRGQNLIVVLLAILALAVLTLPLSLVTGRVASIINGLIALPVNLLLIALTRRGFVDLAALVSITGTTVSLGMVPFGSASFLASAYFFVLNTMVAGVILRPWGILATTALNLGTLGLVAVLLAGSPPPVPTVATTVINAVALLVFVTIITVLSAITTARALATMKQAREEARQANLALAASNTGLEQQVSARTAELSATLAALETQARDLQAALATQQQLNELVTQLSLPVIPVSRDTLVVPVIGVLDSARAGLLTQRVLDEVAARRARRVILDVTGVSMVDTHMAQALLQSADATRLIGAHTFLVGIRPEVAQTIVSLGLDLAKLRTYADLQTALADLTQPPSPRHYQL